MDPYKQLNKKVNLKALPKWKARVEIAKDVIAAIKAKKLTAEHGTYVRITAADVVKAGDDVRGLTKTMKSCEVCALGACLIAEVARNNELNVANSIEEYDYTTSTYGPGKRAVFGGNEAVERLNKYFSLKQLALIETAFDDANAAEYELTKVEYDKAVSFYDDRLDGDDNDHILAIMENIVQNKGTFKP